MHVVSVRLRRGALTIVIVVLGAAGLDAVPGAARLDVVQAGAPSARAAAAAAAAAATTARAATARAATVLGAVVVARAAAVAVPGPRGRTSAHDRRSVGMPGGEVAQVDYSGYVVRSQGWWRQRVKSTLGWT